MRPSHRRSDDEALGETEPGLRSELRIAALDELRES